MKALLKKLCMVVIFVAATLSLSAQWLPYPTPGVPKTSAGQPDLDAPAPRTADGKPDLSGIWRGGGGTGQRGAPSDSPVPLAAFRNVGAGFKEGLPLQPWAAELLKKRLADNSKDNPEAHCLPITLSSPSKEYQVPIRRRRSMTTARVS